MGSDYLSPTAQVTDKAIIILIFTQTMAIRMYILHVAQMFLISYRCHQMHISYIIQIGGLDENVKKRTLENGRHCVLAEHRFENIKRKL